ncbi:MAG: hypothetical protein R2813_13835 [Flavobacteriales bacterium]
MKYALSTLAFAVSAILLHSCLKDRDLSFQPTLAIPIVEAEMTIADLVGATPSEINQVVYSATGTDTIWQYELIYVDTLDPLTLADFGAPAGSTVPFVNAYTRVMDERNVFLRMTGEADAGEFQFTNPRVEFHFDNQIGLDFELTIGNTYTKAKTANAIPYRFRIQNQPTTIPANSKAVLLVSNETTNDSLTEVFSPVPKFLYYTPTIYTPGKTSEVNNGNLNIYSKVILPFTGYGQVSYSDTMEYDLDVEQVKDVLDFAFLRLKFENSMPLEATVTGQIVDSNFNYVGDLPLYDFLNSSQADANYAIIPGGSLSDPQTAVTDVRIYKEKTEAYQVDLETLGKGRYVMIYMTFGTDGFENEKPITMRSDQKIKFSMGIKTKAGYEINSGDLRDTLGL